MDDLYLLLILQVASQNPLKYLKDILLGSPFRILPAKQLLDMARDRLPY